MNIKQIHWKRDRVDNISCIVRIAGRQILLIVTAVIVIVALSGCATESEPPPVSQFIVMIDSMQHTPFGALGDTISIKLYGMIGTDGCSSFFRMDEIRTPGGIELTVWGQRVYATACPAVIVYLDGKEVRAVMTQMGWYTMSVRQPNGTMLKDSIIIK